VNLSRSYFHIFVYVSVVFLLYPALKLGGEQQSERAGQVYFNSFPGGFLDSRRVVFCPRAVSIGARLDISWAWGAVGIYFFFVLVTLFIALFDEFGKKLIGSFHVEKTEEKEKGGVNG